eukprot:gene11333-12518_t
MAVNSLSDDSMDICKRCGVKFMTYEEKISLHRSTERSNYLYHKNCFKCTVCHRQLSLQNYFLSSNRYFYCILHCDFENGFNSTSITRQLKTFKGNSKDKLKTLLHYSPYAPQRNLSPVQVLKKNKQDKDLINEHYCFCKSNSIIQCTDGFWIECKTKECRENNYIKYGNAMIFNEFTHKISEKPFEIEQYNEQIYEIAFKGTQHHNYYVIDDDIDAVVLSLKQEYLNQKEFFRILVRSSSHIVEGLLATSCICANKYNELDVLEALRKELRLSRSFRPLFDENIEGRLCKLDKIMHKSEFKVGLLFIKDGQETEEEFFTNSVHTPAFEEFLLFLGENVLLKGFTGFNGGLDTVHNLTGERTIFTRWNNHEFMFHVSTLLPTDEHDDQKLQRKRHIGNDIVCIVFLSSPTAVFVPSAIKSNFLHIYIVVRPANSSNMLKKQYEVSVVSKSLVLPFGPPLPNGFFSKDDNFRDWIMTKIVNGERASYRSPKFASMQERTKKQMLNELINDQISNESLVTKTKDKNNSIHKLFVQRSLTFPDWMQRSFDESDQLQKDFTVAYNGMFNNVYDVSFVVGMNNRKSLPAVKSILAARSRIFHEMFYEASDGGSARSSPCNSPLNPRKQALGKSCSSPPIPSKKKLSFDKIKRRTQSLRKEDEIECTPAISTIKNMKEACRDRSKWGGVVYSGHQGSILTWWTLVVVVYQILPSLLSVAHHYEVSSLAAACMESFDDIVDIYNVCPLLVSTRKFSKGYNIALELQNKILLFIGNHFKEISNVFDIASLTEDCLFLILSVNLKVKEIDKLRILESWAARNFEKGFNDESFWRRDSFLCFIDIEKIGTSDLLKHAEDSRLLLPCQMEAELAKRNENTPM